MVLQSLFNQPQQPQRNTLQNIGLALQGFGAGVGGRGEQFAQRMRQERQDLQNLNRDRIQVLAQDARTVNQLLKSGQTDQAVRFLQERENVIQQMGGNPQDTAQIRSMVQQGNVGGAIQELDAFDQAAVNRGFLQPVAVPIPKVLSVKDGFVVTQDPTTGEVTGSQLKNFAQLDKTREVQRSNILPGGEVQVVYKDGTTEVVRPTDAERQIIVEAENRGTDLQKARAAGRAAGAETTKQSIKAAGQAFDQIAPIQANIANYDRAIQAIDEGASTGVINRFLPSVKAASIKLDNVRRQLGLDVVGSVTFGALSEGELKLALDTALPTNLRPEELKKWIIEKRDAQQKLVKGLEDNAIFLLEGNTVADLVKLRREQAGTPTTPPTMTPPPTTTPPPPASGGGQILNFDAQGNLIQ